MCADDAGCRVVVRSYRRRGPGLRLECTQAGPPPSSFVAAGAAGGTGYVAVSEMLTDRVRLVRHD